MEKVLCKWKWSSEGAMGEIGVLRADFHFPLEIRRNRSKSEEKTLFSIIFESFKDFRDLNFLPSSCFPDTYYFLKTLKNILDHLEEIRQGNNHRP